MAALCVLAPAGYFLGRMRAMRAVDGKVVLLHSIPAYHGAYAALWACVPALLVAAIWFLARDGFVMRAALDTLPPELIPADPRKLGLLKSDILNVAMGVFGADRADPAIVVAASRLVETLRTGDYLVFALTAVVGLAGLRFARGRISVDLRARNQVESALNLLLILCSLVAVATTLGIVASLLGEAVHFFAVVNPIEFLFGTHWAPQMAIRADQVGSSGAFGAVPLFAGTLLISAIAMLVAVPLGLMSAIFMSEYADPRLRTALKPILEILAGIPTVVYGYFAAQTMAPLIRSMGGYIGLDVSSESALAAGVVMGVMIIPFVSSLSDDVINAVPQSLRDGSYGLGATKSETIRQVVLPAALPGIVAAIMLAVSRAIGETMIVTMAAGLTGNLSFNPLDSVTTVTTQIAMLLVTDSEFNSPKTLSAFGLGLVLFIVTLALNMIALRVVQKYRERYD